MPEERTHELQVKIRLDHSRYVALVEEANRRQVPVEKLVARFVQGLIRDLDRAEKEGTDHPIIPA